MEDSTTLLRSIRREKSQGKLLPPKLERPTSEYRESQLIGTETHDLKPSWEQC